MTKKLLYWTPRILSIIFAVFISLFALDVFSEGFSFWETVLALVMHLIPTYLIIIAIIVAWKWEIIGGGIFIALGLFYIVMAWPSIIAILFISGPLFLIGGLYIFNRKNYSCEMRSSIEAVTNW